MKKLYITISLLAILFISLISFGATCEPTVTFNTPTNGTVIIGDSVDVSVSFKPALFRQINPQSFIAILETTAGEIDVTSSFTQITKQGASGTLYGLPEDAFTLEVNIQDTIGDKGIETVSFTSGDFESITEQELLQLTENSFYFQETLALAREQGYTGQIEEIYKQIDDNNILRISGIIFNENREDFVTILYKKDESYDITYLIYVYNEKKFKIYNKTGGLQVEDSGDPDNPIITLLDENGNPIPSANMFSLKDIACGDPTYIWKCEWNHSFQDCRKCLGKLLQKNYKIKDLLSLRKIIGRLLAFDYKDFWNNLNPNCRSCINETMDCIQENWTLNDVDGDGFLCQEDCVNGDYDNDPLIYPGTIEICNDDINNDCDGLIDCADPDCVLMPECQCPIDLDEDGFIAEECGGDDCDDNDSRTNPIAPEICDDKDNDCDGEVEQPTSCYNAFGAVSEIRRVDVENGCSVNDIKYYYKHEYYSTLYDCHWVPQGTQAGPFCTQCGPATYYSEDEIIQWRWIHDVNDCDYFSLPLCGMCPPYGGISLQPLCGTCPTRCGVCGDYGPIC